MTTPATTPRTPRAATPATPNNVVSVSKTRFLAWKESSEIARAAVGYDKSSQIYGKTDVEVLAALKSFMDAAKNGATQSNGMITTIDQAIGAVEDLLKRKTAKAASAQMYKGRK